MKVKNTGTKENLPWVTGYRAVRVQWHWAQHGMCLEGTPMDPPVDISA